MATIDFTVFNEKLVRVDKRNMTSQEFDSYRRACKASGCRYRATQRTWVIELAKCGVAAKALKSAGFQINVSTELRKAVEQYKADSGVEAGKNRLLFEDAIQRTKGIGLLAFQPDGVKWLASRIKALLVDDPGLGKTVQALVALPDDSRVLVVCPGNAKGVWRRELLKWRSKFIPHILKGRKSFRYPEPGELVITNFEILPGKLVTNPDTKHQSLVDIPDAPPGVYLIGDEVHAFKSGKTIRTKKFRALRSTVLENGGRVWGLTGTPMMNRPIELFHVLVTFGLEREAFGQNAWPNFLRLFKAKKLYWGGYEFPELTEKQMGPIVECLRRVWLRRLRKDVLPDLPTKTRQVVPVDIFGDKRETNKRLNDMGYKDHFAYTEKLLKQFMTKLRKKGVNLDEGGAAKAVDLAQIQSVDFALWSSIRKALAIMKIPAMMDEIEEYESQDEPLVVFCKHRAPIDLLAKREGWAVITGDTPQEKKTEIEDGFQAGRYKGLGVTIGAGRESITLHHSHIMVFVDLSEVPTDNTQAEDRLLRIGQKCAVLIKILTVNHVVENRVNELLVEKQKHVDVVDATAVKTAPEPVKTKAPTPVLEDKPKVRRKPQRSHAPETAQQGWAASGLLSLAAQDEDGVLVGDGVGFNRIDGAIGRNLAERYTEHGELTDKQWNRSIRLLRKYHNQVGECPESKKQEAGV